jgi:hypothetical protein
MQVIYMEQTILLMSQKDPEGTKDLIASGIIKQDENNKPYLVVNTEEDVTV